MSQQELTFIAGFLRGFDRTESGKDGRKGVNLEKLGQYLGRDSLQNCLTPEGSEWAAMLDENHCLRDHPLIVKQDLNFSLIQSHGKLVAAINNVFSEAYRGLINHFEISTVSLTSSPTCLSSQIVAGEDSFLLATCDTNRKLLRLFKVSCTTNNPSILGFKSTNINIDPKQGLHSNEYIFITLI